MLSRLKMTLLFIITTLILLAVAYFFGAQAGQFISSKKSDEWRKERDEQGQYILKRVESLKVGQKLPNYFFYDIDGNFVELEKIVKSNCMISYILVDCPACDEQLATLTDLSKNTKIQISTILVSYENPFQLIKLKEQYQINFPILYDHGNQYGTNLDLYTYPFNILIDSGLVIRKLIPGQLLKEDYKEVITMI